MVKTIVDMVKKPAFGLIFVYLVLFGPKVLGIIDFSVLINLFVIAVAFGRVKYLYKHTFPLLIFTVLLITYSLVIMIFTGTFDIIYLLKFVRVFIAILGIPTYVIISGRSVEDIIESLLKILALHAVIIVVGATIWKDLQEILRPLSGFAINIHSFRSTGLTNGFDFAGVLCVFGLLLTIYRKYEKYDIFYVILFIVAGMLTSRINMIVVEMTVCFLVFFKNNLRRKVSSFLKIILLVSVIPVIIIFLLTTNNAIFLLNIPIFQKIFNKIVYSYANTDILSTIKVHYSFDNLSVIEVLFGSMKDAFQDPGYTQYIYKIGVVGLVITLLFYCCIIFMVKKYEKGNEEYHILILIIVAVCLGLSIKNSYLLARHVTELLILVYSVYFMANEQKTMWEFKSFGGRNKEQKDVQ